MRNGKNKECFIEKGNCTCNNNENNSDRNIYAITACMSVYDECRSESCGDSSKLTNCILDSGRTCDMTPEISAFISSSLQDMDKHIEVADGYHVTAKLKGQVRIKMCDENGDPFIATLQNLLLGPHLCKSLFSIIMLMNLGHTCLFYKELCTVYFVEKEKNAVTL